MNTGTAPAPQSMRNLPSLFDVGERLGVIDALLAETGGEITPEIETAFTAFLNETEHVFAIRLDQYVAFVRRELAIAAVARAQAEQYLMRAKSAEHLADAAKRNLLGFLLAHSVKQAVTASGIKVYAWGNGGRFPLQWQHETDGVPLDMADPALAPFVKTETIVQKTIDTDAIYAALAAGKSLPFVKILPRGHHLRIV